MRNLLVITQKVDAQDDLLGFFVDWISELAKKFDKVFVITLAKGDYDLPSNVLVYSLGKEGNSSKLARFIKFYKYLFQLVPKSSGIFAHMSPIFVIASWPAAFLYQKKIILWYLHRSVTLRLKIAEKLCYKIITAAKESLNIKSRKIVEVGHGINSEPFRTERDWKHDQGRIISVGRISPIKNYETIIKALALVPEAKLNIVGKPVMKGDSEYLDYLKSIVSELKLKHRVNFSGFVPHDRISDIYKNSDYLVGALPTGGVDKVMLEAMASGCITLTSNEVFKQYFGEYSKDLIFSFGNSADLGAKLERLIKLGPEQKDKISEYLAGIVKREHNLKNLVERLSQLYE